MATAVTRIRPFQRKRVCFTSKQTGQQVEYFEVHAHDMEGNVVVIRSGDVTALQHLEVGKNFDFEGEVRQPTTVSATLMRPVGEAQETSTF